MKIMESSQRNGEGAARNPWYMKTNLQYIDKQLVHRVISKDDSLLQRRTPTYTHAHKHRLPLWILQGQQGKYLCFESITSHIFIFLSPRCHNFLPCQTNQNAKTKRGLRERLRFSTVRFTNAPLLQTGSVLEDMTCCMCVSVDLCEFSGQWEQYSSFWV